MTSSRMLCVCCSVVALAASGFCGEPDSATKNKVQGENSSAKLVTRDVTDAVGLIPSWAKSVSGPPMINARSETAATMPSFRDPMKLRRCIVPADGFYEWQRKGKAKQPFCFEVVTGPLYRNF